MRTFRKKSSKAVTIWGVVLSVLMLAFWGASRALDNLFAGMCGGEIYASVMSPDGVTLAYSFERDCGATTGFASFVTLRPASQKLILSERLNRNVIIFQADGWFEPDLKWLANDKLQVNFAKGDSPSKSEIRWQAPVKSP